MRPASDEWRSFLTLATELHFHKASKQLFISQPALSKQIRKLEERVGAPLFTRNRHKVVLTEAGRALVPLAQRLLQDSNEAMSLIQEMVAGRAGTLRIGFGISGMAKNLPQAILRFQRIYERVDLEMYHMRTPLQIDALLNRKIDIGIVRLPIPERGLDCIPLFRERLLAATPRAVPYKPDQGLACLRDRPFILLRRLASKTPREEELFDDPLSNAMLRDPTLAVCQRSGFTPRVIQEASDMFTIINLVSAGIGVSLVPSAATCIRVHGVAFHELHMPEAEWTTGIAWDRRSEKASLISKFVGIVTRISSQRRPAILEFAAPAKTEPSKN